MHLASNIDLTNGVIGGLIIGTTSSALYYFNGKTTGISGIVEGILVANSGDEKGWTMTYFLGLLSSGILLEQVLPSSFGNDTYHLAITPQALALAGLLTGFGTRLGSGCTSGHGICGLPRRSMRSLTAVLSFMASGAVSAYVSRNTPLSQYVLVSDLSAPDTSASKDFFAILLPTAACVAFVATLYNKNFFLNNILFGTPNNGTNEGTTLLGKTQNREQEGKAEFKYPDEAPEKSSLQLFIGNHLIPFVSGLTFGIGLGISGMCNPARVLGFLNFSGANGWDPTLMGVMGGGVLLNLVTFHYMHQINHEPMYSTKSVKIKDVMKMDMCPENTRIDRKLIAGSALFGLGWGLGGMCPGPAIVSVGAGARMAGLFVPFMIAGMGLQEALFGSGLPWSRR